MQARRAALIAILLNTFTVVSQQRPQHGVIEAKAAQQHVARADKLLVYDPSDASGNSAARRLP